MDATKIDLQIDAKILAQEYRNKNSDIRELRDITSLAFSDFFTMLLVCVAWNVAGGIFLIWVCSWSALLGAIVGSAISCVIWGLLSLILSHAVWIYAFYTLWWLTGILFASIIAIIVLILIPYVIYSENR